VVGARAADGALTLARAFQLMAQALTELRAPVPHEALRLRMAAMHGREDPLLDAGRFARLLRQANDAEIADVRKVGEDEYEITPHRSVGAPPVPAVRESSEPREERGEPGETAAEPVAEAAGRDNGQRFGVRFRRGSRGPLRAGEVPLIGVVQIEAPEPVAVTELVEEETARPPAPKKTTRTRAPRKKAAPAAAAAAPAEAAAGRAGPAGAEPAPAAARPKRARPRAKKKAE
jgi:hypothetical protein